MNHPSADSHGESPIGSPILSPMVPPRGTGEANHPGPIDEDLGPFISPAISTGRPEAVPPASRSEEVGGGSDGDVEIAGGGGHRADAGNGEQQSPDDLPWLTDAVHDPEPSSSVAASREMEPWAASFPYSDQPDRDIPPADDIVPIESLVMDADDATDVAPAAAHGSGDGASGFDQDREQGATVGLAGEWMDDSDTRRFGEEDEAASAGEFDTHAGDVQESGTSAEPSWEPWAEAPQVEGSTGAASHEVTHDDEAYRTSDGAMDTYSNGEFYEVAGDAGEVGDPNDGDVPDDILGAGEHMGDAGEDAGEDADLAVPLLNAALPGTSSAVLEEIAARLERIARSLRSRDGDDMAGDASDPLEVLITGYALGYSEGVRSGAARGDGGV